MDTGGEVDVLLLVPDLLSFVGNATNDGLALIRLIWWFEKLQAVLFLQTLHSRVDLVDIKDTSRLELGILVGLPGAKSTWGDLATLEAVTLSNGCGSDLSLVDVVKSLETNGASIQISFEVAYLFLVQYCVKFVLAVGGHNDGAAAIVNVAIE